MSGSRGLIMKYCPFIRVKKEMNGSLSAEIYVPPPTSVMGGMARRAWLIKHFEERVLIASRDRWDELQKDQYLKVQYLVEEDGQYREEEQDPK